MRSTWESLNHSGSARGCSSSTTPTKAALAIPEQAEQASGTATAAARRGSSKSPEQSAPASKAGATDAAVAEDESDDAASAASAKATAGQATSILTDEAALAASPAAAEAAASTASSATADTSATAEATERHVDMAGSSTAGQAAGSPAFQAAEAAPEVGGGLTGAQLHNRGTIQGLLRSKGPWPDMDYEQLIKDAGEALHLGAVGSCGIKRFLLLSAWSMHNKITLAVTCCCASSCSVC